MSIKFKNGSEIKIVSTDEETKRGYIRCRKLTDKEYNHMINAESDNAENRVSEILQYLEVDRYCRKQPLDFLEQFIDIELFPWQKKLLDMQYKGTVFVQCKNPGKEFSIYLKLLLTYMHMKKDDAIGIVNHPDNVKILSKDEFGEWLQYNYWR